MENTEPQTYEGDSGLRKAATEMRAQQGEPAEDFQNPPAMPSPQEIEGNGAKDDGHATNIKGATAALSKFRQHISDKHSVLDKALGTEDPAATVENE